MNKEAIRLIDRLYKDLYLDEQVIHHGTGNKYDKFNNIKSYIEKLESIHNKIQDKERHIELLKKLYYEKYVIKKEDIPESYYKHQQEIALERGYGHIEITESQKQELQNEVINNQKASIDTWLDYFLSEDANVYPFWAKYWAFQGMLKLGTYDKEKGTFNKRDKNTVSPFVDLNREALAMSIDLMIKLMNKEQIEDKELENLIKTGSFQKIYSHILTKVLKDNKNITKRNIGKWIKYDQGSDHMPLVQSLQGYNTGWCTAGESTAKSQLSNGDFYVYYTLDENNEYKVPRIAIRMEYGKIGEIRGIAKDQNLEPEMEEVVEEKIKEFPDKEEYYKKVKDMKLLTHIYKKNKLNQELTKDELIFLYEINEDIIGFGYDKDPRIEEINRNRNKKKDLSSVLNCKEEQIAITIKELNKETIYYNDDLNLSTKISANNLILPKYVKGSLNLSSLASANGLVLPEKIGWHLKLSSLTSAQDLVFPKSIGGSLDLISLMSAEGLVLPKNIGRCLFLSSLTSTKGLVLPESIGGTLDLRLLTSAKGLKLPESIGGSLNLTSLISSEDLVLPQNIGGCLILDSLKRAEGLVLPQKIDTNLYLDSLTSAEGLIIPDPLTYKIYMNGFVITPYNVDKYRSNRRNTKR